MKVPVCPNGSKAIEDIGPRTFVAISNASAISLADA